VLTTSNDRNFWIPSPDSARERDEALVHAGRERRDAYEIWLKCFDLGKDVFVGESHSQERAVVYPSIDQRLSGFCVDHVKSIF
jgi:hypothetical protein